MVSEDTVQGLSGNCPWTQWTLSMDSVLILQPDNVHGQCPPSPWTFYRRALILNELWVEGNL